MQIDAAVIERADGVVARRQLLIERLDLEGPREDEVLIRVIPDRSSNPYS